MFFRLIRHNFLYKKLVDSMLCSTLLVDAHFTAADEVIMRKTNTLHTDRAECYWGIMYSVGRRIQ